MDPVPASQEKRAGTGCAASVDHKRRTIGRVRPNSLNLW
jgi:hypothetical protein